MSSSFEIHTEDTLAKIADLLGMDANLTMSALAGLVELSRSAHLLNYRKITECTRLFIVKYSLTTRLEKPSLTDLKQFPTMRDESFYQSVATHLVIGIVYGAEVYFVFERTLFPDEDQEKIDQSVMKLLGKLATLRVSTHGQLD